MIEGKFREVADKNSYIKDNYIHKSKIRDKIKELEKDIEMKNENGCDFTLIHEHEVDMYGIIETLKELLGE